VLLHELGHDLVFALQLGFELLDLLVLGVLGPLGFAAVIEGQVGILEQQLLPGLKDRGFDAQLLAELGNGCALEKVPFDSGHFLGDREMATRLLGHGKVPPFRLC